MGEADAIEDCRKLLMETRGVGNGKVLPRSGSAYYPSRERRQAALTKKQGENRSREKKESQKGALHGRT